MRCVLRSARSWARARLMYSSKCSVKVDMVLRRLSKSKSRVLGRVVEGVGVCARRRWVRSSVWVAILAGVKGWVGDAVGVSGIWWLRDARGCAIGSLSGGALRRVVAMRGLTGIWYAGE